MRQAEALAESLLHSNLAVEQVINVTVDNSKQVKNLNKVNNNLNNIR
jgi:hypothetical protein